MLPPDISEHLKRRHKMISATSVSGGCINECYELKCAAGKFFLKINSAVLYPGLFKAEAKGLNLLATANSLQVPKVADEGIIGDTAFLLLQFIERGNEKKDSMRLFGRRLAELHRNSESFFGFGEDNYIGSLPQQNSPMATWPEFFTERRLLPLVSAARDENLLSLSTAAGFEKLFSKLPSIFPTEKPALLHGDLWAGNYFLGTDGEAYVFDPAVYYGHREMDIGMSKLFGGFNADFYSGYNEIFPLEQNWVQRIDLCNLYPLLVHVNLFGASYSGQLKSCLAKYI